jgi:hypothetical protein
MDGTNLRRSQPYDSAIWVLLRKSKRFDAINKLGAINKFPRSNIYCVQINRRNFEKCAQQSANRPPNTSCRAIPGPLSPAKPDVPSWQAALATETAGPRIRRSDDELKLERDFQLIADRVLTTGETDDLS